MTVPEPPLPRVKSPLPTLKPKVTVPLQPSTDSNLTIARLENHIEMLADRLRKLQSEGTVAEANTRFEQEKAVWMENMTELHREILGRDRSIAVLQNQNGQCRDQIKALEDALERANGQIKNLQNDLFGANQEIFRLTESGNSLENRVKMLLEDCFKFGELIEERLFLKEKLATLTSKHARLELDVAAGNVGLTGDSTPLVQLNDPLFRVIYPHLWSPTHTQDLSLARPTYASLISKEIPAAKVDIAERQFGLWLEVTIRGIYDSKYAEHVLTGLDTMRSRSSFPEFVYSWMGMYAVDERKREVVNLEWSQKEEVDTRRYQLLLSLSTERAKKAWEMWTFREFLMENMDLDALAFFLHCRQLLFQGPQLQTNHGKYAVVHYVPISHAHSLIDTLMAKLPYLDKNNIKAKLVEKSRSKDGAMHIDASYVLRLFLVYYEREKRNKYKQIEELFLQAPKENIPEKGIFVSFFAFRQILLNVNSNFSDMDLVRLYRLTWELSTGSLTAEALFLALSRSGGLSHCLRLGGLWPLPVLNAYNDLEAGLNPLNDIYVTAVGDWKQMSKRLELLKDSVTRMGLLGLTSTISKCELVLRRKGQLPLEETGGRHVGEMYARLWATLGQAGVVQMELLGLELRQQDENTYAEFFKSTVEDLKQSCYSFHSASHGLKISLFTLKYAVNKIQRIWKMRHPKKQAKRTNK